LRRSILGKLISALILHCSEAEAEADDDYNCGALASMSGRRRQIFLARYHHPMKSKLTVDVVELQQCPRPRDSDNTPRHSESPDSAQSPTETRRHTHFAMASSTDAAFVEEIDVEQELRMRANQTPKPNKSGANSQTQDNDDEDAPLLSPSRHDYGSVDDDWDNNRGDEWAGNADFRGLPWWKRPSVSVQGVICRESSD